jgi:hypothetical protein
MIRRVSWFEGSAPRSEAEAEFLAALRTHAANWQLDVGPEHTGVLTALAPLYVDVEVPGLPQGNNKTTVLQGGYWTDASTQLVLQAEWGDTHLLDNGGHDDDLSVGGVRLGPSEAAAILANWFDTQLRRPVQLDEWIGAEEGLLAAHWRLADTGRPLAAEGSWLRRKRAPTRVTTVRPPK